MDRQDRTAILEPLLLILKQRTGIATILSIVVLLAGNQLGIEQEVLNLVGAIAFTYIGGQKWVDSKEASNEVGEFVLELVGDEEAGD